MYIFIFTGEKYETQELEELYCRHLSGIDDAFVDVGACNSAKF